MTTVRAPCRPRRIASVAQHGGQNSQEGFAQGGTRRNVGGRRRVGPRGVRGPWAAMPTSCMSNTRSRCACWVRRCPRSRCIIGAAPSGRPRRGGATGSVVASAACIDYDDHVAVVVFAAPVPNAASWRRCLRRAAGPSHRHRRAWTRRARRARCGHRASRSWRSSWAAEAEQPGTSPRRLTRAHRHPPTRRVHRRRAIRAVRLVDARAAISCGSVTPAAQPVDGGREERHIADASRRVPVASQRRPRYMGPVRDEGPVTRRTSLARPCPP